jgi:hypothetical protein
MRLARTLGLAAGLAAAASMALAGAASAKPIEHTEFHGEFTEIFEDFCDVPGLTVQFDHVDDGRFLFNPHGPDGLAYAQATLKFTNVFTNLANGNTVTEVGNAVDKDLLVTDNGDGTLTILIMTTGNSALYGPDGKAIGRNPGQVRFEILIDDGGTPTDPSDDEFLEDLGLVKGSTGRTDDFCAAVLPVLAPEA